MKRLYILLALVAVSMSAHATNYGRWLCDCRLIASGNPAAVNDIPEIVGIIKALVNPTIQAWKDGDFVTVCDGKICLTMIYRTPNAYVPVGGTLPDSGKGYKHGTLSLNSGVVGGSTAQYSYLYRSIDYTVIQHPVARTGVVTVGPITPVPTQDGGFIGGSGFNMSFDWGTATNSDAAATGQGGTVICGYSGCRIMPDY